MSEAQLLEKLSQVVHPKLGVVRWLVEAQLQPDEPPIHISLCEFTNALKIRPQRISDEQWQKGAVEESRQPVDLRAGAMNPVGRKHATGAAGDRVSAMWATIGEACERYAMHLDAGVGAVSAREDELPGPAISPDRFILFSDEQYEDDAFLYGRYERTKALQWRPALNLSTGEEVWAPAQFVSGPLVKTEFQPLDSMYSTGCAAGSCPAHAVSTGLREVIERDAFMFYWLSRTRPRRIVLESAAPHLPEWLRPLLAWHGVDTHALWFETDHGVPVICTLLLPRNGPGVAIGASCHLDWRQALEKSLVEAFHTLNWVIDMERWNVAAPSRAEVRDFHDHVAFYRDPARRSNVDFLLGGPPIELAPEGGLPQPDDYRGQTREMVRRLAARDLHAYVVDLTPPDLASVDIHVARVLVPGMHPLHCGVGAEHLDRRRIDSIAQALGVEAPAHLNLDPHPFP